LRSGRIAGDLLTNPGTSATGPGRLRTVAIHGPGADRVLTARDEADRFLTVREAGELLKIPAKSVYVLVQRGLPHYRLGRRIRIRNGELQSWMEEQREDWA
jgi:excisionase family DNA binding protein